MVVASVYPPIPKGPSVTAPLVRGVALATTYIAELAPAADCIDVTDLCSRGLDQSRSHPLLDWLHYGLLFWSIP